MGSAATKALADKETSEIIKLFEEYDMNGDGTICKVWLSSLCKHFNPNYCLYFQEELKNYLKCNFITWGELEEQRWQRMDKNHDDKVSLSGKLLNDFE